MSGAKPRQLRAVLPHSRDQWPCQRGRRPPRHNGITVTGNRNRPLADLKIPDLGSKAFVPVRQCPSLLVPVVGLSGPPCCVGWGTVAVPVYPVRALDEST